MNSQSSSNRRLLSDAAVAILDQALLSAMNFSIGLAFIRLAGKTEYGIYTQLFALLLLSQSLQGALANAPLVSLGPKRRTRSRQALAAQLFRMQTLISVALAVIAFCGVEIAGIALRIPAMDTLVAIPFAIAIFGQWLREYARKYCFLRLEPLRALQIDGLYAVVLGAGIAAGIWLQHFGIAWVFASMGMANIAAGLWGIAATRLRPLRAHGYWRPIIRDSWDLSRWTLPGVLITWAASYSFVYIVAAVIGVAAAAEISAARLLIMPAGLCITAWGNNFNARFSEWIGQGDFTRLKQVMLWSAIGLASVIGSYCLVLLLFYDLLQTWVLGPDYAGIQPLVVAWALYFILFALRKIGTSTMIGGGHYRDLLGHSCVNLVINLPTLFLATWWFGTIGAIVGLIISETVSILLLRLHGWPRLLKRWQAPSKTVAPGLADEVNE